MNCKMHRNLYADFGYKINQESAHHGNAKFRCRGVFCRDLEIHRLIKQILSVIPVFVELGICFQYVQINV